MSYVSSQKLVLLVFLLCLFFSYGAADGKRKRALTNKADKRRPSIPYLMNAIGCDVCLEISRQVLRQVDIYKEASNMTYIPRYHVESIMEHICDPYALQGAWIRQFRFHLRLENSSQAMDIFNEDTKVHFEPRMEETVTKCNRVCGTVQNRCMRYVDHALFNGFSKTVSMLSLEPGPAATYAHLEALNRTICQPFEECRYRDKVKVNCDKALNNYTYTDLPRHLLLADEVEPLPAEEFQTQFRLFKEVATKNFTESFQNLELKRISKMAIKDVVRTKRDFARRKFAAARRMLSRQNITSFAYASEFLLPNITNDEAAESMITNTT